MRFLIVFAFCLVAAASANPFNQNFFLETLKNNGRISNGEMAENGQFPYQVGLLLGKKWCSGSLISSTWVLTAAHCTDGVDTVIVYLGATVRERTESRQTVTAKDIIVHKGWNRTNRNNDISLIKIAPVQFTDRIQMVELPAIAKTYPSYVGEVAIFSGWGRLGDDWDDAANNLQFAPLTISDNKVCDEVFGLETVTPSLICIATPNNISPCDGDSGGPLVLESNGKKIQIGILAFGHIMGCEKGYPTGFTRVTSYLDWIKENSGISYSPIQNIPEENLPKFFIQIFKLIEILIEVLINSYEKF